MGFPTKNEVTPLRSQYLSLKADYPNHLMLFEYGDYYEAFDKDAETLAEDLDLTLTERATNRHTKVPMAGFPKRFLDENIQKLVKKGRAVAVAQQQGEPFERGLVERRVTQVHPEPKPVTETTPETSDSSPAPQKDATSAEDALRAEMTLLEAEIANLRDEKESYARKWADSEMRYDKALLEIDALKSPIQQVQVKFFSGSGIGNSEKRLRLEKDLAAVINEGWELVYEIVTSDQDGSYYYARFQRTVGMSPAAGDEDAAQAEPERRLVTATGPAMTLVVPPAPEKSFSESLRTGASPDDLQRIGTAEVQRIPTQAYIHTVEQIVEEGFTTTPEEE